MDQATNSYSPRWFDLFHFEIDEARTTRETEFICNYAPLPAFRKVLDVCCGAGRHSRALVSRGYSVTGLDRDAQAIAMARNDIAGAEFVTADIRSYELEREKFDVVIVMGQSFGHFDVATNREILSNLVSALRPGGRLILDVWNPEFFSMHQGVRELKTSRATVREDKRIENDRLFVKLDYSDGFQEGFEWQLFTPPQMKKLGLSVGLRLVISCSAFDAKDVSSDDPRIQFILERTAR